MMKVTVIAMARYPMHIARKKSQARAANRDRGREEMSTDAMP